MGNTSLATPVDCVVYLPRFAWLFQVVSTMLRPALRCVGVFVEVEYELSVSWSGDSTTFESWSTGYTRETVLSELAKERLRNPQRVFRVEMALTFIAYGNSIR